MTQQAKATIPTSEQPESAAKLSAKTCAKIDTWCAKFPDDQRQSAVLSALHIVQEEHGWLTKPLMNAVADYLCMPRIAVYEVATFYSMYSLKPVGKHKICVCTNISCLLCGSQQIIDHLHKRLGIKPGETSADGKFTLQEVECLAACTKAPVLQLDKDYHENLTPEKIDQILSEVD